MLLPEILCMPASAGLNHTSFTTPRYRPLPSMSRHPRTLMARAASDPRRKFDTSAFRMPRTGVRYHFAQLMLDDLFTSVPEQHSPNQAP
jgi:hypothetical protein